MDFLIKYFHGLQYHNCVTLTREDKTDGGNTEFSKALWRPRTGDFTTYTVLSFEAS